MANYEQIYQKSIAGLKEHIKKTKIIPTEKIWNKIAVEKDYLTSQSLGYLSGEKFCDLCKKIYSEILK